MRDKKVEQLKNRLKAMGEKIVEEEAPNNLQQQEVDQFLALLNYEVSQINQNWNVNPEFDIISHRRRFGKWIVLGKKIVRKFLRWYINPAFEKQRIFNANATRSFNALTGIVNNMIPESYEKVCYLEGRIKEIEKILYEESRRLEDSISKLENKLNQVQKQLELLLKTVKQDESSIRMNEFNYFLFEQKFRGTRSAIKERQRFYLPYFLDKKNVLDIGSGRGEFIELLIENGINVKGIDVNQDMVDFCKSLGFDVDKIDAIEYLSNLNENALDGVFMAQVAEHLPTNTLLELIDLVYKTLKPGGIFVVETINVQSLYAMSNWFYMDPTHIKPVHPETLRFLLQEIGFSKVNLEFLSPVEDRKIEQLNIEGIDTSKFNESIKQLQDLIYGHQDFAAIAIK